MTREEYLTSAIDRLRPYFEDNGVVLPPTIRVSVGWPSRSIRKVVGQCFMSDAAGHRQIFISPVHNSAVSALDTLAHELVHAAGAHGHGREFRRFAKAIGLTSGRPKSASAGPELLQRLNGLATELGHFPHAALAPDLTAKQGTRLLKIQCRKCGYVARVTAKWLDEIGLLHCPLHGEMDLA
jgi:hypothetical protein